MLVAIHQPHYLPWLPYLSKLAYCDLFIVLDDVEFTRNGWQNRNKIRGKNSPTLLTIPVKQKLGQYLSETEFAEDGWRRKHWLSLEQSYSKSPYFGLYREELKQIYSQGTPHLSQFCVDMLQWLVDKLGLKQRIALSSQLGIRSESTQRLIDLVKAVGGSHYLSGSYALQAYLDGTAFSAHGLKLELFHWNCPEYRQRSSSFQANLATLDPLFEIGAQETLAILKKGGSTRPYEPHSS